MIVSLTGGSGVVINNTGHSWPTYSPQYGSNAMNVGQVRYNVSMGNLEVFDGSTWHQIPRAYPTVALDDRTQQAVDWAQRKMFEERRLNDLAAKSPALADALANLKHAQEQVQIVAALVDN